MTEERGQDVWRIKVGSEPYTKRIKPIFFLDMMLRCVALDHTTQLAEINLDWDETIALRVI